MKDLLELREEIDGIDNEIVRLYEKRMEVACNVAAYKIANDKPVFDKEREIQKLDSLSKKAHSEFNSNGVRELFEQIMAMSRKKQYQLLNENGKSEDLGFVEVDSLKTSGVKVVFQGVEGAYSQQAMKEFFGDDCDGYNVDTWKDAMEEIKNGKADYAVLPIENSSAGIVSENYDLLAEYDNYIVGEHTIKIDHALLGLPEAKMSDITCVYTHPQGFMQCEGYLENHKDWERTSMKNTALSAKRVKEDGKINQAAIAGAINADIYGLKCLDHAVQDNKNNFTRFIIVSGKKVYAKDSNKICLCFEIPHECGSLYHMLSHFIYNGINLTNIQSRPIAERNWEYRFIVELEGKFTDMSVLNALRGLSEEVLSLKILGNY